MAIRAQSNQIRFAIIAKVASGVDVMDLQVRSTSAVLASPPVAPQDFLSQRPIGLGREALSAALGKSTIHGSTLSS
jgi:hypothetical protein